jgi:hypothetical protein
MGNLHIGTEGVVIPAAIGADGLPSAKRLTKLIDGTVGESVGELWVDYTCTLKDPTLSTAYAADGVGDWYLGTWDPSASPASPLNVILSETGTLVGQINRTPYANYFEFPYGPDSASPTEASRWLFHLKCTCTVAVGYVNLGTLIQFPSEAIAILSAGSLSSSVNTNIGNTQISATFIVTMTNGADEGFFLDLTGLATTFSLLEIRVVRMPDGSPTSIEEEKQDGPQERPLPSPDGVVAVAPRAAISRQRPALPPGAAAAPAAIPRRPPAPVSAEEYVLIEAMRAGLNPILPCTGE